MTHQERARTFLLEWVDETSNFDAPSGARIVADALAAEFDAVAREAADEMRERCAEVCAKRHFATRTKAVRRAARGSPQADYAAYEAACCGAAIRSLPLPGEET